MTTQAYPLQWPNNWARTHPADITDSRFDTSFGAARDNLLAKIRRLGGVNIVISTNIQLRNDGLPCAKFAEPNV
jgi:hypothetical protein